VKVTGKASVDNAPVRSAPAIAPATDVVTTATVTGQVKAGKGNEGASRVRTVRKGETLSGLISETYGFSSRSLIAFIQKKNPAIRDANLISVGDRIVFPAREERADQ
jgi:nucleoid-associated protein YgaU